MMTPAERHDWLVKAGADRYVETYMKVMKYMAQGGRTPGIRFPTPKELRALYESTTKDYWQNLNAQDPQEAQSQIEQWKKIGG